MNGHVIDQGAAIGLPLRAAEAAAEPPAFASQHRATDLPFDLAEAAGHRKVLAREGLHRRSLAAADALAALLLAALIAVGRPSLLAGALIAVPVLVLINKLAGLYDRDEVVLRKSTLEEAPALLQVAGLYALVVFLVPGGALEARDRTRLLVAWAGAFALLLTARAAARAVAGRLATPERCLTVGSLGDLRAVAEKLRTSRVKADIVATLELPPGASPADLAALPGLLERHQIDRLIVAPTSADAGATLEGIRIGKRRGVRISLLPRLFEAVGSAVEFDELGGLTMLGLRRSRLSRSSRILKRGFDLAGSTAAIVTVAPLMAVIAVAVRLESPGPVLFRQERIGRNGRPFRMLKFRSMVVDAEARKAELTHLNETFGLFKIAADPRVTRVGRFIRRSCLDELPQLFNVWRGEMSLVGPRPLVADEDQKIVGLDRTRLDLTPGMTGPWQVLGSLRVPMHEMVAIDYLYVNNWTLWSDVKLILRTLPVVLSRGSA